VFPVQLSPGSTVKQLKYTVVDSDSDPGVDSFSYLIRERLAPGLTKDAGYSVMAVAHSTEGPPPPAGSPTAPSSTPSSTPASTRITWRS